MKKQFLIGLVSGDDGLTSAEAYEEQVALGNEHSSLEEEIAELRVLQTESLELTLPNGDRLSVLADCIGKADFGDFVYIPISGKAKVLSADQLRSSLLMFAPALRKNIIADIDSIDGLSI